MNSSRARTYLQLELTLEQHKFALHKFTCTCIFFNKYMYCFWSADSSPHIQRATVSILWGISMSTDFGIQEEGCPGTNPLWMLRDNLNIHQVNLIYGFSTAQGPVPNLCVAQRSTVYSQHWDRQHLTRGTLNIHWMKFTWQK